MTDDRFCSNPNCIWHDTAPVPFVEIRTDDAKAIRISRISMEWQALPEGIKFKKYPKLSEMVTERVHVCATCFNGYAFIKDMLITKKVVFNT